MRLSEVPLVSLVANEESEKKMLPPLMMQTRSGERDINIEETVCSVRDRET